MARLARFGCTLVVVAFAQAARAEGPKSQEEPPADASAARASSAPSAARVMSFDEAIKRAVARNPTAEGALQEIRRAEALLRQARAGWLPTLTANATYTRLDGDRMLGDRVIVGADSLGANLTLTVPIVAPRAWVASARRGDEVELARLGASDAKRQVALAAGKAYLTVVAQRRVLSSAERARATARAHEDFAKQRLGGGVGNRLDAVRASQERATAEAQVQSQRIALGRSQEALGVLVGEEGPVDVGGDASLPAPASLTAALGEAARRSDVVAQRERVEVARKADRDSYADYLPVLSAVGQPFYQTPATLTQPTTGWQAQLVFSLPLYEGGNRYGLSEERKVLHEEAKTKLDAALRQARSEVRLAFDSMRLADEAMGQAREAAKLAHEALELAELAYAAGATSNLEIIDAEQRARVADTAAVVAEDVARQARLDLLAACGRFPFGDGR